MEGRKRRRDEERKEGREEKEQENKRERRNKNRTIFEIKYRTIVDGCFIFLFYYLFFYCFISGRKPRVLCMLAEHCTTDIHPKPSRTEILVNLQINQWIYMI